MRFYCIKWPLEDGIIVCDGVLTTWQAKIDREFDEHTHHRTTFSPLEFVTDIRSARRLVASALTIAIEKREEEIAQLKANLQAVINMSDEQELWTATGKELP